MSDHDRVSLVEAEPCTWEVRPGDCLDLMAVMPAGSVDAIVTSPPYADQRNYAAAARGETVTYGMTRSSSRRQRSDAPGRFVEAFTPVLEETLRVCAPTGSLMLNLGVIMRDGEEHPYADEILHRARQMGWKLLHRTVWHKPNALPLSHAAYLHIKHEWVFWLAPSALAYRGYDKDTRTPHSPRSLDRINHSYKRDSEQRKDQRYLKRGGTCELHPDGARPSTVYTCGVGGDRVDHPAIMPLDVALYLVSLSCPRGGVVLDPYCGSGTTGVAALRRRRNFIGLELEEKYVELARARIREDAPLLNSMAEAA